VSQETPIVVARRNGNDLTPAQRRKQIEDALTGVPDAALEPILWLARQFARDPYDPEFWRWLAQWAAHQARQNGGNHVHNATK
jgi:hypothetical protein